MNGIGVAIICRLYSPNKSGEFTVAEFNDSILNEKKEFDFDASNSEIGKKKFGIINNMNA